MPTKTVQKRDCRITPLQKNSPWGIYTTTHTWGAIVTFGMQADGEEETNDPEELSGLPN